MSTTANTPATRGNGALAAPTGNAATATVRSLLAAPAYKRRFEEALGARAPQFIASIAAAASQPHLAKADPNSVIAAAFIAATLDLPVSSSLGFAHIVPYRAGDGSQIAQFQMGYKGYIQLALRTGQYKALNDFVVYEGELKSYNAMTGALDYDPSARKSDVVIGYAFYFELLNGFSKTAYWPKAKVEEHAKTYSKSFKKDSSPWKTNFDAMALKTVISATLRKYGILSVEMQGALENDGTARTDLDAKPVFPDSTNLLGAGSTSDPEAPLVGATEPKDSAPAGDGAEGLGEPPQA